MEDNKLKDMINASLENIRSMLDANTIIGDPIVTDAGTTLIPVSKITVGYVSGGIDYKKKGDDKESKFAPNNFGGGGGTGITVSPVAYPTPVRVSEVEGGPRGSNGFGSSGR